MAVLQCSAKGEGKTGSGAREGEMAATDKMGSDFLCRRSDAYKYNKRENKCVRFYNAACKI